MVDHQKRLQPVRDQGDRPTCLAFAATCGHEDKRQVETRLVERLSEEALYWGCKELDVDGEGGTTFESASVSLERWGQPLEESWPYDPTLDGDGPSPLPTGMAAGDGWFRRSIAEIPTNLEQVKAVLAGGGLVLLGLELMDSFMRLDAGHIPAPSLDDENLGGHAVVAVGYDDGSEYLIVRNSWGTEWGIDGYGYLPYSYYVKHGLDNWILGPVPNGDKVEQAA
jgi:C1A family cysteine protease